MIRVVAALIHLEGKLLICQRHHTDPSHPLKWEFPGGKVQADESTDEALVRELQEELGIQILEWTPVDQYTYTYSGRDPVELHFFLVNDYLSLVKNLQFESIKWIEPNSVDNYDFLAGDREIVSKILNGSIIIPGVCTGCPLH